VICRAVSDRKGPEDRSPPPPGPAGL